MAPSPPMFLPHLPSVVQPAMFLPHSAIRSVELMRAGGASSTFDMVLHLKRWGALIWIYVSNVGPQINCSRSLASVPLPLHHP